MPRAVLAAAVLLAVAAARVAAGSTACELATEAVCLAMKRQPCGDNPNICGPCIPGTAAAAAGGKARKDTTKPRLSRIAASPSPGRNPRGLLGQLRATRRCG